MNTKKNSRFKAKKLALKKFYSLRGGSDGEGVRQGEGRTRLQNCKMESKK